MLKGDGFLWSDGQLHPRRLIWTQTDHRLIVVSPPLRRHGLVWVVRLRHPDSQKKERGGWGTEGEREGRKNEDKFIKLNKRFYILKPLKHGFFLYLRNQTDLFRLLNRSERTKGRIVDTQFRLTTETDRTWTQQVERYRSPSRREIITDPGPLYDSHGTDVLVLDDTRFSTLVHGGAVRVSGPPGTRPKEGTYVEWDPQCVRRTGVQGVHPFSWPDLPPKGWKASGPVTTPVEWILTTVSSTTRDRRKRGSKSVLPPT